MLINLKALVVVLTIATMVFVVAKPVCLRFMAADEFARRRNIWFALTLTAFTSPSFWIYAAVAVLLAAWGTRKDSNPMALYVLLAYVIPPSIAFDLPAVGVNRFFQMSNYRILAFAILLPAAWPRASRGCPAADMAVGADRAAYLGS